MTVEAALVRLIRRNATLVPFFRRRGFQEDWRFGSVHRYPASWRHKKPYRRT